MSSSRVIRGTKAKIFLYVCAILIITALIACYNNTLSQLEDLRRANEICHQQEEKLSTQLQVISDYKQRLEKSLKTEKAEHQQTKNNLESKLTDEKTKNEKLSGDALLKYNSLQQHFNLLQTQYDDFKEESSKLQEKQLEEINNLQSKLQEVKEELKKIKNVKDDLKIQNDELQTENINLKKQIKDAAPNDNENKYKNLLKDYEALKSRCPDSEPKLSPVKSTEETNRLPQMSPSQLSFLSSSPKKKGEASALKEPQMEEIPVMAVPGRGASTSSTARPAPRPSQGVLSGARPLLLPEVTPGSEIKAKAAREALPEGVVPIPDKKESQNEQPEVINGRYQHKIDGAFKDDVEKENGAHEEFDMPIDGLGFNDELNKQVAKPNIDKKDTNGAGAEDKKQQYEQDYKDSQNEVQLEQEEDDDLDDYADHDHVKQKEPAIRN